MPPKTEHIIIRPNGMDEIDIVEYIANRGINADARHPHGVIS
jgi:hypothetical protein